MLSILFQGLLVFICSTFVWKKLLREYVVNSPLDRIPGPPASSLLIGNLPDLFNADGWKYHYDCFKRYGGVMKIKGLLGDRQLYIYDPGALYHILVKDQDVYEESEAFTMGNKMVFGEGILSTLGEQHRKQRKMLSPVFSLAHMRQMTPTFYEVAGRLRKAILARVGPSPTEIDMLRWTARSALELIGQSGMDYSFDTLEGDSDEDVHPFGPSMKRLVALLNGPIMLLIATYIVPVAIKLDFPRTKRWLMDLTEWGREVRSIANQIHNTAVDIYQTKLKAMETGHSDDEKKDIISALIRANRNVGEGYKLSEEEIYGQVASITAAATDTTSSSLSRILHLLSINPAVQDKLRAELIEAKKNNGGEELAYDELVSLPYLDAICRETLRVYPPLTIAIRVARKDMILPLSKPMKSTTGHDMTEILVPNGTTIYVSLLGANTIPEMWGPDSYEWKPERWLKPLPQQVEETRMPSIYSHIMTFLGGGRSCIGFKFSQLEMKVVLSVLLTTFKIESSEKKIVWKMTGVAAPVVEGDELTRPSLPMMISLLDKQ